MHLGVAGPAHATADVNKLRRCCTCDWDTSENKYTSKALPLKSIAQNWVGRGHTLLSGRNGRLQFTAGLELTIIAKNGSQKANSLVAHGDPLPDPTVDWNRPILPLTPPDPICGYSSKCSSTKSKNIKIPKKSIAVVHRRPLINFPWRPLHAAAVVAANTQQPSFLPQRHLLPRVWWITTRLVSGWRIVTGTGDKIYIRSRWWIRPQEEVCQALSLSITNMMDWAAAWHLPLNISKSCVQHFDKVNKTECRYHDLTFRSVTEVCDVGICLNSRLDFKPHIEAIIKKLSPRSFLYS